MFREMRRKNQQLSDDEAAKILENGKTGVLAVLGDKVSFCVIAQDDVVPEKLATRYRSVIAFCKARVLETENEISSAALALGLKYYDNRDAVEEEIRKSMKSLACVELTIEHLTGKMNKSNI
jgi:nitroimidazol reductase NimA-like FMN-containing flavoprotein (pyridoxamine 5'-phosphate oxidase superfamily)